MLFRLLSGRVRRLECVTTCCLDTGWLRGAHDSPGAVWTSSASTRCLPLRRSRNGGANRAPELPHWHAGRGTMCWWIARAVNDQDHFWCLPSRRWSPLF